MQAFKISAIALFFLYNYVDCDPPLIGVIEEFRDAEYIITEEVSTNFIDSLNSEIDISADYEDLFEANAKPAHVKAPHQKPAHPPKPAHQKVGHPAHVTTPHNKAAQKPHVKVVHPVKKEPTVIVKEHVCPKDTILADKYCLKTVVFKAHSFCPAPSKPVGHKCVAYKLPDITCPNSYTFEKKQCVRVDKFPASLMCHGEDEILNNDEKCCEKIISKPPYCPSHSTLSRDGECIVASSPKTRCEPGFKFSHGLNKCYKEVYFDGTLECPPGSTLDIDINKCLLPEPEPVTKCPAGYNLDANGDCIRKVAKIGGGCSGLHHHKTEKGTCELKITHTPLYHCDSGYTLINNQCQRTRVKEPSCPIGYYFSRKLPNVCEKIVNEIPSCPAGSELIQLDDHKNKGEYKCKRLVKQEMTRCCEAGYELVNSTQCTRLETRAPQLSCGRGCFKLSQSPASYYCPEGSEFVHNTTMGIVRPVCIRSVELNVCVRQLEDTPECTTTTTLLTPAALLGDARAPESENGVENPIDIPNEPKGLRHQKERRLNEIIHNTAPLPECGFTPSCRNITRVEVFDAQAYCPNGGNFDGTVCIMEVPIIPEITCKKGVYNAMTGFCEIHQETKPVDKCPPDSHPSGSTCISYKYESPQYTCPEGSFYNENQLCVIQVQPVIEKPYTETRPMIPSCPPGQYLNHDKTLCIETIQKVEPLICPPYSIENLNGECIVKAMAIEQTSHKKYVAPTYVCPGKAKHADTKGRCKSIEISKPYYECDEGVILDTHKNLCIKRVDFIVTPDKLIKKAPILVCPHDSKIYKDMCVTVDIGKPIITCPPNYTLHDGKCTISLPAESLCPVDTESTHQGCIKHIKVPAQVKIVKGCTFTPKKACSTCKPTYDGKCNNEIPQFHDKTFF